MSVSLKGAPLRLAGIPDADLESNVPAVWHRATAFCLHTVHRWLHSQHQSAGTSLVVGLPNVSDTVRHSSKAWQGP